MLEDKVAVVYGAGGAVGGAVAREFAREGAQVFLSGRSLAPVDAVAGEIAAAGGAAETAQVDALDEAAVEEHMALVCRRAGRVDVSFNAIGIPQRGVQGVPLLELSPESFGAPIAAYTRTHFLTARAAARRMAEQGSGVIVTLTAIPARAAMTLVGGMAPAWAAVEALTRSLAAELGPRGVRAICLRSHAIPETPLIAEVMGLIAEDVGLEPAELTDAMAAQTLLRRLPTLAELAAVAAFVASDRAGAMTGTVANLSAGAIVD